MAIPIQSLKDTVLNNLIMGGFDKATVTAMLDTFIVNGVAMFWKERAWSFSMKTDTFTLTTETVTGYSCPADCDGIVRLKRETTADSGVDLIEMPPHVFDEEFPYPDSLPSGDVIYYKVEVDAGQMKIFVYPISNSADTVRRTYKIKFSLNTALGLIPEDYRHVVAAACMYQAMPSGKGEQMSVRMMAYQEYDMLLKKAMNLDRTSYRRLTKISHAQTVRVNPNSWKFYLGEYEDA